jgi:phage shock protein A
MLAAGHLESTDSARAAHQAMEELLANTAGPLPRLAREVVARTRNVWPALRRARRGEEADEVRETRNQLERRWNDLAEHLGEVAARYDEAYARKRGS